MIQSFQNDCNIVFYNGGDTKGFQTNKEEEDDDRFDYELVDSTEEDGKLQEHENEGLEINKEDDNFSEAEEDDDYETADDYEEGSEVYEKEDGDSEVNKNEHIKIDDNYGDVIAQNDQNSKSNEVFDTKSTQNSRLQNFTFT